MNAKQESLCVVCGGAVIALHTYCEPCRLDLYTEDRLAAVEEQERQEELADPRRER